MFPLSQWNWRQNSVLRSCECSPVKQRSLSCSETWDLGSVLAWQSTVPDSSPVISIKLNVIKLYHWIYPTVDIMQFLTDTSKSNSMLKWDLIIACKWEFNVCVRSCILSTYTDTSKTLHQSQIWLSVFSVKEAYDQIKRGRMRPSYAIEKNIILGAKNIKSRRQTLHVAFKSEMLFSKLSLRLSWFRQEKNRATQALTDDVIVRMPAEFLLYIVIVFNTATALLYLRSIAYTYSHINVAYWLDILVAWSQ